MNWERVDKYFTKVGKDWYASLTERERVCYAVTTHIGRQNGLEKRKDTYILEVNEMRENDDDFIKLRETTSKGYKETYPYDGVELSRKGCTVRRGVSHEGMTGALNTSDGSWGTVSPDYRIRKLTPRECERLQGFPDDYTLTGADGETISDTQRYKCLGNAVTTNVITWIIENWDFKVGDDVKDGE